MEANRPPILKKVTPPTSEESVQLLKSIDSSLETIIELSKRGIGLPKDTDSFNPRKTKDTDSFSPRKNSKKENPLEDIQNSLIAFQKSIKNPLDVSSLSKRDARSYLETQKNQAEKERESIIDTIEKMKTSLFKKKSMTEEDVGTLNELNKIYSTLKTQEKKQGWISTKIEGFKDETNQKLEDFKKGLKESWKQGFMTLTTGITAGLMGPLNLVFKPIEDLFGFQFSNIFEKILFPNKNKKKDLNKKFIKPKRSDMMKYNPEAVYLADMIAGPNAEGADTDSIIDKLFGGKAAGMAGKVLPFLAKAIPIAAIIGSLVWAVFDGIKASKLADEWGVSSTEAFIGGFLAGTGSGWKNAFKNAGKWGLMGAGVGFLFGGPVGAIIGGLIGAAVGGLLGYFGGEKVSQGVKKIWKWLDETLDFKKILEVTPVGAVLRFFDRMKETWKDPDKTIGEKIKDSIKGYSVLFKDLLFSPFTYFIELFKGNIIKKHIPLRDIGKKLGEWLNAAIAGLLKMTKLEGTPIGNIATKITDWIANVYINYFGNIEDTFVDFAALLKGDMKFKEFALNLVKRVFGGLGDLFGDFLSKNPVGKFITDYIITPISEFFAKIGDTFEYFSSFNNILDLGKAFVKGDLFTGLGNYQKEQALSRRDERRNKIIDDYKDDIIKGLGKGAYDEFKKAQIRGDKEKTVSTQNKLIDFLLGKGLVNKQSVNDAIIHPSGQIIVPHKDDTIIATKNPVDKRKTPYSGADNELQDFLSEKLKNSQSLDDNRIVQALEKVVAAIENKPFNNIMTNVSNNKEPNFDDLRFAF